MSDENWDDACEAPYVPNIENQPVIKKTPPNLSKAQKKKFYKEESERWARLRKEQSNSAPTKNTCA